MHKFNLSKFTRGWLIGDFEPSILRTKDFEFMVRHYTAGESEATHTHKIAHEVTVVVSGEFKLNDEILHEGDVVHLEPGEATDFSCLKSGATAVIKTPSIIGDKYLI